MTRTSDIIVFTLPVDRARAALITEGLVSAGIAGPYATRLIAEHPDDAGWREAERAAESSACVVFCWSVNTAAPDAHLFRDLGARVLAANNAISVELDRASRPPAMARSTTYPLYGWCVRKNAITRFCFGDGYVAQIVVAAREKVIGNDPPSPGAIWNMVRAQAYVAALGLGALIGISSGVLQFYRDPAFEKWLAPETAATFETAKAQRSCPAMRAFVGRHGGSAWGAEATELLASCTKVSVTKRRQEVTDLAAFGMTLGEAQANGKASCAAHARNTGGTLITVKLEDFIPSVSARALCTIDQPYEDSEERMGGAPAVAPAAG